MHRGRVRGDRFGRIRNVDLEPKAKLGNDHGSDSNANHLSHRTTLGLMKRSPAGHLEASTVIVMGWV